MTPTDLLDLRRRVARAMLGAGRAFHPRYPSGSTQRDRSGGQWAPAGPMLDWLPVLDDPGTWGAMTARLVELAAVRGWRISVEYATPASDALVMLLDEDGDYDRTLAHHVETGVALALALVDLDR
jgi:hypothetical protein